MRQPKTRLTSPLCAGLVALPLLLVAWACSADFGGVGIDEMPIGFVSHYPMTPHNDDEIAATGATVMEVRAPWTLIQSGPDQWDFSPIDRQLEWARQNGLKLVHIVECGPAHTPQWARRTIRRSGGETRDVDGKQQSDPSIFSPVYHRLASQYIQRVVSYIREHNQDGVVVGYNNGCEWWYPLESAYSPLDVAAFRPWLRDRYKTIAALNELWESDWASWDDVDAPRLAWVRFADSRTLGALQSSETKLDSSFHTTGESHVPIAPRQEYEFAATCDLDADCEGAYLEIAWLGDAPKPLSLVRGERAEGPAEALRLSVRGRAPQGAKRAWLLLKHGGPGHVVFQDVSFSRAGDDENLAPNPGLDPAQAKWSHTTWIVGERSRATHSWEAPGRMVIDHAIAPGLSGGHVKREAAAVYDWSCFLQDSVAGFIDWLAAQIKIADPSLPVITYLTYSFGHPFHWDYVIGNNIALDRFCEKAAHQDVLGMQIASAHGDYHHITASLDLARKYGKPMWAIDLLDFTLGVGLGERGLLRTSLSLLQHGGTGISYYCWWGTPDYNYSELGIEALTRMIGTTKQVAGELNGLSPVAEVALVQPIMPAWAGLEEPPNDFRDFMGWYKLVAASGLCPDVYTLHELERADLTGYKLVIVPDCAYIGDEALSCLRKASEAGVPVTVPAARFALLDMSARPRAPVQWGQDATVKQHENWGRAFLGPIKRITDAGNTPPMFVLQPGAPRYEGPELQRFHELLADLGVTPTVQLSPADPRVEACLLSDGDRANALLLTTSKGASHVKSLRAGGQEAAVGSADPWALTPLD